jgi:hypothetical protein
MKRTAAFILQILCLSLATLHAGTASSEVELNYSYVGGADSKVGASRSANISEQSSLIHYVISPQIENGMLLRIGMDWQRYSFFSVPGFAQIPDTLQANNLIIGADLAYEGWLIRIEAQPGFYGDADNIRGKDFNVPFLIGGSYIVNGDWQWIVGVRVDFNSEYPVFGAVGLRWRLSEKWVFNGILPRPRLEYEYSKSLTFFGGAEVKDGTFRVGQNFGSEHGNASLNNAVLDYTEVRTGVGASWKISSNLKLDFEAGYMAYRKFNFHRADVGFENNSGAAYGQIVIGSQF